MYGFWDKEDRIEIIEKSKEKEKIKKDICESCGGFKNIIFL